jgi:polysaccharide biosynthesis protein PslH
VRILLVTPEVPWPPINGMRLQVLHVARELAVRHEVCVLGYRWPEQEAEEVPGVEVVAVPAPSLSLSRRSLAVVRAMLRGEPVATELIISGLREPLTRALAAHAFDVVHLASGVTAGLKGDVDPSPIVVAVEAWHLNVAAARELDPWLVRPFRRLEERRVRRFEARELPKFARVVMVTEQDAAAVQQLAPGLRPVVIPNGVDSVAFAARSQEAEEPGHLVFTGALGYPPNVTAAKILAERIFPLVRASVPQARLSIVGRAPGAEVSRLGLLDGVQVVPDVPDIRPWLHRAQVYVCPMISGTGIKNKLLEAMACARPSVATPLACQGIHVQTERELLIADGDQALAAAVTRLLGDAPLRTRLGAAARQHVVEHHSWSAVATAYEHLYDDAISAHREGVRLTV